MPSARPVGTNTADRTARGRPTAATPTPGGTWGDGDRATLPAPLKPPLQGRPGRSHQAQLLIAASEASESPGAAGGPAGSEPLCLPFPLTQPFPLRPCLTPQLSPC